MLQLGDDEPHQRALIPVFQQQQMKALPTANLAELGPLY